MTRVAALPSMASVVEPEAQQPAQARDAAWVERAYVEHHAFVWRVLARIGVPQSSLEDALHEVFIVLHRRRTDFDGRSSVRTWLHGIATRIGLRWRARARREPPPPPCNFGPPDPESVASDAEALARVEAALARLAPERREVFVLCELEDMTGEEVAVVLNMNRNTVYSRLRLARRDFQLALGHCPESKERRDGP